MSRDNSHEHRHSEPKVTLNTQEVRREVEIPGELQTAKVSQHDDRQEIKHQTK